MHTLPSATARLCSPTLVGVHQRLPHLVCQSHAGVHSQTKGATHNARRRLAHMLRVTEGRTEHCSVGGRGGREVGGGGRSSTANDRHPFSPELRQQHQ